MFLRLFRLCVVLVVYIVVVVVFLSVLKYVCVYFNLVLLFLNFVM